MTKPSISFVRRLAAGFIILSASIGGCALDVNAQDIRELLSQADSLVKIDKFQKAADLYIQILEITPEDVDIMLSLGKIYFWTGKYIEAEKMLNTVINLTPEYEDAYQILSNVYLNQGRTQDAINTLRRLWERNSTRNDVIHRILFLYHQFGNYREARSMQKILRNKEAIYNLPQHIERDLYAWRGDINYTYEEINLLPDWNETAISMAYCLRKGFTAVGSFQRVNRFEKVNLMSSISAYFSLPARFNWYINLGYTPNTDFLPDFRVDVRAQTQIMRGSSLIASTNLLSFQTEQFQIYSLGAEQYFSGRISVSYQYFICEPGGSNTSFSHLLKANWFGDNLTSTLGCAWGNEIFRVMSYEELRDVKIQTCFGMLTYWIKSNAGIKLNFSYTKRINSYTRRGIGGGLVYKF